MRHGLVAGIFHEHISGPEECNAAAEARQQLREAGVPGWISGAIPGFDRRGGGTAPFNAQPQAGARGWTLNEEGVPRALRCQNTGAAQGWVCGLVPGN